MICDDAVSEQPRRAMIVAALVSEMIYARYWVPKGGFRMSLLYIWYLLQIVVNAESRLADGVCESRKTAYEPTDCG